MTAEEFYRTESNGMLKYALSLLRSYHDAQDAVSECFLRLLKSGKLETLGGERRKAYAMASLRNVCLTMLRERGRFGEEPGTEPSEPPADRWIVFEADLDRAFSQIGGICGNVLRLRFLEDYKIRDISAALGLNENHVKIMIFRGKKQLAEALGESYAC